MRVVLGVHWQVQIDITVVAGVILAAGADRQKSGSFGTAIDQMMTVLDVARKGGRIRPLTGSS